MRLKVGDKVRITFNRDNYKKGDIIRIDKVSPNCSFYTILKAKGRNEYKEDMDANKCCYDCNGVINGGICIGLCDVQRTGKALYICEKMNKNCIEEVLKSEK